MSEIEQREAAELSGPPAVAQCKHCQSHNLKREGFYRSKVLEEQGERRQIVRCDDCQRFTYLPLGIVLERKPRSTDALRRKISSRIALYDRTRGASDVRPNCPRCGGNKIHRHRKLNSGKRCYECRDCRRSFVAEDAGSFLDRRRTWLRPLTDEALDPDEEAIGLIKLFENGECKIAEIRELIAVTPGERRCLEFLSVQGMLPSVNVEFMLNFRDRVMEKFNSLVNAELLVLARPPDADEKKEAASNLDLQYQTGDELVTQKDDR